MAIEPPKVMQEFLDTQVMGSDTTVGNLLLAIIILSLGIVLSIFVTRTVLNYINNVIARAKKRELGTLKEASAKNRRILARQSRQLMEYIKDPIERFIRYSIILTYGLLAFFALGFQLTTPIEIGPASFTIEALLRFILVIIIIYIFSIIVLRPLSRVLIEVFIGNKMSSQNRRRFHKEIQTPLRMLLFLLGVVIALDLGKGTGLDIPYRDSLNSVILFVAILLIAYVVSRVIIALLQAAVFTSDRFDEHTSRTVLKLINFLIIVFGLTIALGALGIDPFKITSVVIGFTFVAIALAFALQDDLANFFSGIFLAMDKPFLIGDRIRVGAPGSQNWGDVVDMGLRSVRIKTTEDELVVIPNRMIATTEVWNFSQGPPWYADVVNIGISYGSDWRLAKKIILEVTRSHPKVLNDPPTFIRIDAFGDFSIQLKLWYYIPDARDRYQIRSDILEAVKDRFDAEGVEIPFPYRTLVFKKDLHPEARLPEKERSKFLDAHRYPSRGVSYIETGDPFNVDEIIIGDARPIADELRILVPVSSKLTATNLASYATGMAQKLGGTVTALYVMSKQSKKWELEGIKALDLFTKTGQMKNVPIATLIETGDVVNQILETIEKNRINLIIMGASPKKFFGWTHEDLSKEIQNRTDVPVITIPYKENTETK